MVDSTDGGYRERYRRAIAEQERMESQFKFQLDALKKTLSVLGAVTKGLDQGLDTSLVLLKDKIRGASGAQVIEQLERVQAAASECARRRQQEAERSAKPIVDIVQRLSELQISSEIRGHLVSFKGGLNTRLQSLSAYPEVLEELRKLQALSIKAATEPPASFWQRLRGGVRITPPSDRTSQNVDHNLDGGHLDASLAASEKSGAEDLGEAAVEKPNNGRSPPREYVSVGFDAGDEDNYQLVADRIAGTLEDLVARIEPNEVVRHKIDIVQTRIQRGLDWFSLAVSLEEVRDILMLRYLQHDQEFSDYLKRVNEELHSISQALGLAAEQELSQKASADNLSQAVSDHVDVMRSSMEKSTSIDQLKSAVSDHLSSIHGALTHYKNAHNNSVSLSEQLRSLVERVHSIENESVKTKALLEEERYKATHDSLTGLPNREAYNERAFHELERYKRYCRPLVIAVCDIDFFKRINDNYGHQTGDKVLRVIAKLIATRLRKVDFVARFGGEEFVILMPETSAEQALVVLDKIRVAVAKTPFKFKGTPVQITTSFGIACCVAGDTVESTFDRADKALYQAKDQGRDCCVTAGAQDNKAALSDTPAD